jgi:hypothetical protein
LLLGDHKATNGHCSDLADVTRFAEDPQQYAADLTALGWREHALQTYRYDRGPNPDIYIFIDRFETAEGAAQALEYFTLRREEDILASLSPAVDRSLLAPNQSANVNRDDWSAELRQQDGTYVMTVGTLTHPLDGPSALTRARLVMDMVHSRWLAWNASNTGVGVADGCDANYGEALSGGCVPADRDYDCGELHALGIGDIPVIGDDWMRLDGYQDYATGEWVYLPDGLGCEWAGE